MKTHKPKTKFILRKCYGINPRTRKEVGERHRWSGGKWGQGRCIYCFRSLDELKIKPEY